MPAISEFTSFDIIVGLVLVFFIVRGLWIGLVRQLAAFFALVGGYWIAAHYHGQIAPYADRFLDNQKLIFLVSFICIFLVAALGFTLVGKLLRKVMEITLMGWFDRLLGGVLGVVKGVVVTSLLYMFLASSISASNDILSKSVSEPYLQFGATKLQLLVNDPRLREYLNPKKLAIPPIIKEKGQEAVKKPGSN